MPNELIEYIKLHLISLEQDSEKLQIQMDEILDEYGYGEESNECELEDVYLNGQISALNHILEYAGELTNVSTK